MDWKHMLVLVVALAAGFYLGKKYPSALAGVPFVGAALN